MIISSSLVLDIKPTGNPKSTASGAFDFTLLFRFINKVCYFIYY